MPFLVEDTCINGLATSFDLAELDGCSVAIDATYYLGYLLDNSSAHEPLLPALGGLTGITTHINQNLDLWGKSNITPFLVFDGLSITGQDEVSLKRARAANAKTDEAWNLYSQSSAEQAVNTFGGNPTAFRLQNLYPLLQKILRERKLHFLVAPYNASAQLAHLEMVDSDQCAAVMGSQELLLYEVRDCVIRGIDFEHHTVSAVSKKRVLRTLGVSESMFIDALLMVGTSFLPAFPPLLDPMYQPSSTIMDAINILRTSEKSVASACASFNDILVAQEPNWLDKYRKARMAVNHFIHITEEGEVKVHNFDTLTQDNHEYLGLQLPAELFHYLNVGLISSSMLNCITHSQILVQPTLDGTASDQYKKLMTSKIVPIKEQALGLIIPRVHRGIGHKDITMRVWFDPTFSLKINHRALQPAPSAVVGTWDVKEESLRQFFPTDFKGTVYLEVLALANTEFVAKTISREKIIRGVDSTGMIVSVAIWRFLHLRGYVDDSHQLTKWGRALATTMLHLRELRDSSEKNPIDPALDEAALLAFELVKFGCLNGQHQEATPGLPRKGSDADKAALVLISQAATLLKLRHQVFGYTGPLNKSLLMFRSLSSAIREADRGLIEGIVASMFMYGQCQRERDDYLEISHTLPFLQEPDIGLGIAVRTFFDDDEVSDGKEARAKRLEEFPKTFVPYAEGLTEDFRLAVDFFNSINQGLQTLDNKELPAADKAAWAKARAYLDARPF
ncbi:XPG I-region protein [Cordyceps fumosorosea ARSEF 2679]|uniref:XPG I-region protein n=1 Tax=Cordyceps fumosorosea (strain ARSEF 2679) TaxID=1081104 RepID=A0A162MXM0_CORFA|nr:XPG I-region protein [Cordyceps fumosorosea ARSEF 2679]OAA72269.1 XPG I-region protein [Cordyceps fumosorosea ARSEF 2679]